MGSTGVALPSETQHRSAQAHCVAQVVACFPHRPAMRALLPQQQIKNVMNEPEQPNAMQVRPRKARGQGQRRTRKGCTHRDALLDEPNLEAQELVHLPHPLAVTSCKVVIDRDHLQQERFLTGPSGTAQLAQPHSCCTAGQSSQPVCASVHLSCRPSSQWQLVAVPTLTCSADCAAPCTGGS